MNNQEQSLDRIKLLMKYSVGNTLTENVINIGLLKEDPMGVEMAIERRNQEILKDAPKDPLSERRTTIQMPYLNQETITVVEDTQWNKFESTDTSGTLFPGLKFDNTYGWYKLKSDGTKVFFPKDEFWKQFAAMNMTKSFKTGPTVTHENGENYHFLIQLKDENYDWATIYYKSNEDRIDRGWIMQPWYYKTEGDKEVSYSPPTADDLRSRFDKWWDEYNWIVQIGGSILIGIVTAGIADIIVGAYFVAEGVAVAEGLSVAAAASAEITSTLSVLNNAKLVTIGLDFLTQAAFNVGIGLYEMDRGLDPTVSFIFAALPLVHNAPGIRTWLGNTVKYTEAECKEIVKTLEIFDGTNPLVFEGMSKPAKELYEAVAKASKANPNGFNTIIEEMYKVNAAKAVTNPTVAKTFTQKAAALGIKVKEGSIKMGKAVVTVDTPIILGVQGIKILYKKIYGKEMPQEEVDKITKEAESKPTKEESADYLESIKQNYEKAVKIGDETSTDVKQSKAAAEEYYQPQLNSISNSASEVEQRRIQRQQQMDSIRNSKNQPLPPVNQNPEIDNELGGSGNTGN